LSNRHRVFLAILLGEQDNVSDRWRLAAATLPMLRLVELWRSKKPPTPNFAMPAYVGERSPIVVALEGTRKAIAAVPTRLAARGILERTATAIGTHEPDDGVVVFSELAMLGRALDAVGEPEFALDVYWTVQKLARSSPEFAIAGLIGDAIADIGDAIADIGTACVVAPLLDPGSPFFRASTKP
jgi:hypothetical protein